MRHAATDSIEYREGRHFDTEVPATMYRDVRALLHTAERVQSHLSNAILADDTPTMTVEAAAAQALTNEILRSLKELLAAGPRSDTQTNRAMVESALACFTDAWNDEEKVAIAGGPSAMRARALTARTAVDYGAAYLRAALGHQDVAR